MSFLPINQLIASGFYFSIFLFLASGLLLAVIYKFRCRSESIFLFLWAIATLFSGLFAWIITGDSMTILVAIGINSLLALGLQKLVPTISQFGVFFLITLIMPPIYGVMWLFELIHSASQYFHAGWPLYLALLLFAIVFSILTLLNTAMLTWIVLVRYSELYFHFPRLETARKISQSTFKKAPWVSIHLPCYAEPPQIVIQTLDALARLQYPHFEVIVLDNNTQDPALWRPLEKHCELLGERFRFFHFDSLKGAKAGALNTALHLTAPQAELISVIDADYIAQPDFLERLVAFFEDPEIGFVQSCQDYRDWEKSSFQKSCYFEYQTHFKLELPGQNEWDVTYTIGTMCLIRRKALEEVGGWSEWCLTEDSEVAVRLHALGYAGYYLKNTFGYGLIPETFDSYKQQRFRWTAGPVQQFQKHWRLYLPWFGEGRLTFVQKFGEIFHSLSVFFSEALTSLINILILGICLWFAITKQQHLTIPWILILFIPLIIMRNILCNWVHIRLLGGNWKDFLLAAVAARSLIYTRNMALYKALFGNHLAWKRTDKFKAESNFWRAFSSCRAEIISALIYIFLASVLAIFINFKEPDMIFLIWLGIANQVLSYLCAPIMAFLSEKGLRNKSNNLDTELNFNLYSEKISI